MSAFFKCQCCPHIETNQTNQLISFYMTATLAFTELITFTEKIENTLGH